MEIASGYGTKKSDVTQLPDLTWFQSEWVSLTSFTLISITGYGFFYCLLFSFTVSFLCYGFLGVDTHDIMSQTLLFPTLLNIFSINFIYLLFIASIFNMIIKHDDYDYDYDYDL